MKRMIWMATALCVLCAGAADAFEESTRQALQGAVEDAQAALGSAGIGPSIAISTLPIAGDENRVVEGLLKNAVTGAGLNYVEGKQDPLWNSILETVEWDERKGDILDASTLTQFGKLRSTQALLYGIVRDAGRWGNRVYVEIELHLTDLSTASHLWGGIFSRRFYLPGDLRGIVDYDPDVRALLRGLFADAVEGLASASKLAEIESVALLPICGDQDQYITGLARDLISATRLKPRDLDMTTLLEARRILRDQPDRADAVLYGAVRDLSRKLEREEVLEDTYEIRAEVQLQIQAPNGDVLWSETLAGEREQIEERTGEEMGWKFVRAHRRELLYGLAGLVGLILLGLLIRAGRRVR
jgi:hypothetical protein